MNRTTTALLAALEALLVVAIGVGIALVPLTVLWAAHFGLSVEWFVFWRAAVDIWLLGNGVDLSVQLGPDLVGTFGLPGAEAPFLLTLAPLGFAVVTVLLGILTGRRAAETPHRWTGIISAVLVYGVMATIATLSADGGTVTPSTVQGMLFPTLVYGAGVLFGAERARLRGYRVARAAVRDDSANARRMGAATADGVQNRLDPVSRGIRDRYRRLQQSTRAVISGALRGGAAASAGVIMLAAIAFFVLLVVNYATIIGLYEAIQAGIVGGATITLGQLAFIPNFVIWTMAWLVGPGIAVGVGSNVSPAGTLLGPVPGLPILGVLPQGALAWGFLGLLVPILIGFVFAIIVRQRLDGAGMPARSTLQHVLSGLGMGIVAGFILGILAWWSAGSLGPGRLADVGPNPLLVGAVAAGEIGVAAALGMLVGGGVRVPRVPIPRLRRKARS
ncbi:DUF6350 family protein [Cryobacterium psychrophilum]|uniref:Uncharacterized protein n=1 Tax=Cryobacterium psychrophilum TaxID=41988 RepID=A0A4Y8KUF5_9MICO|nr:DUF6350 family protein [Cryobacterium psychrophilum]TDW29592.1 hypothetical protein EDD25_1302 [Cryobacterium psychrophilum]TFD81722.1 hypothetical protein E3T53_01595 [Cryobacterium psychrophilum]